MNTNSFNLSRCYNKQADGLYPRLLMRGREIITQGKDAGVDEHDIWLDWSALMRESVINPEFHLRTKFQQEFLKA